MFRPNEFSQSEYVSSEELITEDLEGMGKVCSNILG